MEGGHTEPSYRPISIIVVAQMIVVVGGTLFVGAMMKAHGYKGGVVPDDFFAPEALFVRHYGFVLLLVPAVWALVAVVTARLAARAWIPWVVLLIGVAGILGGILGYLALGFQPTVL